MAMNSLRIRHALRLTTSLLRHTLVPTTTTTPAFKYPIAVSARQFHRTPPVSYSSASRSFNDMDTIDPDTVLFEGCDYKHWLIVMDFGKDPSLRPPPDQMVDTYVQTAAQVLGSVEEAKSKIYACSTTTYTGFQVLVDEEVSKKFEGLPGVLFVLPDSYIDPVNKEYGGDKYNNGEIIPRPPPVQYGRAKRPSGQTDQRPRLSPPSQQGNASYNPQGRPAYNQQGNPPNQQGNPAYNQRAPAPGDGRGYTPQGPQQGFQQQQGIPPQQNYPPRQNYVSSGPSPAYVGNSVPQGPQQGFQQQQGFPPQQNFPPKQNYGPPPPYTGNSVPTGTNLPGVGRDGYQSGTNFVPPQQENYNHGYNHPQGQINNRPGNVGGYAPPSGQFRNDAGNFGYNHPQGQGGYAPSGQMGFSGDTRVNSASPGAGSFEQRGAGHYGQNAGARYPPQGGNERFPPTSNEQSDPMQQRNYPPTTQAGFNQGRY